MRRVVVWVGAVVMAAVAALSAGGASTTYTHGYDVSWPQCSGKDGTGRSARSMPAGWPLAEGKLVVSAAPQPSRATGVSTTPPSPGAGGLLHWRRPLAESQDHLRHAIKASLETGAYLHVAWGAGFLTGLATRGSVMPESSAATSST